MYDCVYMATLQWEAKWLHNIYPCKLAKDSFSESHSSLQNDLTYLIIWRGKVLFSGHCTDLAKRNKQIKLQPHVKKNGLSVSPYSIWILRCNNKEAGPISKLQSVQYIFLWFVIAAAVISLSTFWSKLHMQAFNTSETSK